MLFRAFFERGEDIGDEQVLTKLAADLHLVEGELQLSLSRREFEATVLADEREADGLGVTGVPAFVADRRAALSGVQTAARLQTLINQVRL